jgi:hypothetical protein
MEPLTDRLDRRRAFRLVAGGLLAIPVGLRLGADADAATSWCRKDPDVLLEGTTVQIVVAVPDQYLSLVEGPTRVSFNLPSGVDRKLVFADSGFNNLGYNVVFSTAYQAGQTVAKFSVNLKVTVPINGPTKVPLQVTATPAKGTAATVTAADSESGANLNFTVYGSL